MAESAGGSREDILDAAERLMIERGYDGTSIAEICRESGLPVGSVYWHFKNKAGVLAAVMERGAQRFFDRLPDPTSFGDQGFDRWYAENSRLLADKPDFLRLLLSLGLLSDTETAVRDNVVRVRAQATDVLQTAFSGWLRAMRIEGEDALARDLAILMIATVDGAYIGQHVDGWDIATVLERQRVLFAAFIAQVAQSSSRKPRTSSL